MNDDQDDPSAKQMPISDLRTEPLAEDLVASAEMQPYLNLMLATMQGQDRTTALAELAALPLEKRYIWRVASALTWAFADLETMNVEADRQTLSREDQWRIFELLKHRPLQFCLFLSALLGQKQMEALMVSALKNARVVAEHSEG